MNGQNSTKKKNAATTAALIAVVVLVMAGVFVLLYVTALAPLMQKRPAPTPQETVQEQPEPQLPTTPAVPEADKPEADAPQTETHPDTEMQPVEPEQEPEPAPEHVIVRVILWMSLPLSAAPAPLKTITPTRDFAAVVP